MAGGLAILLGTLLGINFPMGGQNASVPNNGKKASVLPANINVNSTAGSRNNGNNGATEERTQSRGSIAQNNNTDDSTSPNNTDTQTTETQSSSDDNQGNEPIRALW
jgi:hypothetical protein